MKRLTLWRGIWVAACGPGRRTALGLITAMLIAALLLGLMGGFGLDAVFGGITRVAAAPLALLALFVWSKFVTGAASLNQPAYACLAPHMNRLVREAAVLAWLLTMLPFAAIAYVNPDGLSMLMFAITGVTALGLHRAGGLRFLAVAALALGAWLLNPDLSRLGDLPLAAALLLSLGFTAWALKRAFPRGGEAHWSMLPMHAQAKSFDGIVSGMVHARSSQDRRPVFGFVLRRDLASKNIRRHLLMHVFGPAAHWTAWLLQFAVLALCIALARPLIDAFDLPLSISRAVRYGIMSQIASLPFYWYGIAVSIRNSAAEQSIARLAPGLPSAAHLNRELGRQLLATCLLQWLGLVVLSFWAMWLWQQPASSFMTTAAFLGALLGTAGIALGDYSGKTTRSVGKHIAVGLWGGVLALIGMLLTGKPLVWAVLMAVILVFSVTSIVTHWRILMAAPPTFPAGRLA